MTPKFGQTQEQWPGSRRLPHLGERSDGLRPGADRRRQWHRPTTILRRQQFGRALAACLEGRGYSVRFVAPATRARAAAAADHGTAAVVAVFTTTAPGIEIPPLCHAD